MKEHNSLLEQRESSKKSVRRDAREVMQSTKQLDVQGSQVPGGKRGVQVDDSGRLNGAAFS
jgi:hypothetical protein